MPALRRGLLAPPNLARLALAERADRPPRILLLCQSLRDLVDRYGEPVAASTVAEGM